jgi:hypothetical protein
VVVAPEDIRVRLRPRAFMKEAVQLSATPMNTDMGWSMNLFFCFAVWGAEVQIAKPPHLQLDAARVMDCNTSYTGNTEMLTCLKRLRPQM